MLDGSGALVLPERRTVVFADLHFEKGSAYAERGALLPPWDSAATLERMEAVLACHTPDRVVCLGDSFHDTGGGGRMAGPLAGRLRRLADRYDWIWIAGNHDPEIPETAGGRAADRFRLGGLLFLHEPDEREREEGSGDPQICGHFHPKARIRAGPRRINRGWFLRDAGNLLQPASGGLDGLIVV
ncbi:MAG: ligase-associated DNA damage response endonuclease PdeM, partial [Rhodospirillaceae bacterium]|nr:ligase-associated DNA damage response endonuclease PdeM [Rhodospirillaceae bacterium]